MENPCSYKKFRWRIKSRPRIPAQAAPAAGAPGAAVWWAALREMPYRGARQCICRAHHRPHLHAPCAVDLQVE
jgi:hypothetical protein